MNINSRKQLVHIYVYNTFTCCALNATIRPDDTNHIKIMYLCIKTQYVPTMLSKYTQPDTHKHTVLKCRFRAGKIIIISRVQIRQCGKHIMAAFGK